jgi:hypothetical protein
MAKQSDADSSRKRPREPESKPKDDGSDSDSSGDAGESSVDTFADFGKRYLKSLGLQEGKPLRPGGPTAAYVPPVTGGFLTTSNASQVDPSQLKVGSHVFRIVKSQNPNVGDVYNVAVINRISHSEKAAEVEYPNGAREKLPFQQFRPALEMERRLFENQKLKLSNKSTQADGEGATATPASSWIFPGLQVQFVKGPPEVIGVKAAVQSISPQNAKANVLLGSSLIEVGFDELGTVTPPVGQKVMFVVGTLKGTIAKLIRVREQPDGAVSLIVTVEGQDYAIEVKSHEVCALAPKKGSS